jgi:ADP-ribose pyrophosphatase YjhB (NUDIX family)
MQEFQDVLRYLRRRLYSPLPYYHEAVNHFCVNCGIPLELRTVEGRELEGCSRCSFVLWRDPKVVTMVVVETGTEEVVMGRRGIEPGYGLWCLPGGYVNDDEHPADAAVRECREEIAADVEVTALLGVYHIRKHEAPSMVGIAYRARLRPGQLPAAGDEMLEVAVFPGDRLPELAFSSHREAMSDWLACREQSRMEAT